MKVVLKVLVMLAAFWSAGLAYAKPIEVSSENFVLIGNIRETDGKALVGELEQYREGLLKLLGVSANPEPVRVRIYTVKNAKELEALTGGTGIAGVYKNTVDGPVFILNSSNGFRRGKGARHIALHEYTHHLISAYTDDVYPRWYNEGLANYFATFEVNKKGHLIIGRPYQPYAHVLGSKRWMPMSRVVGAVLKYPYSSKGKGRGIGPVQFFYAQSWLATHYIISTPGEAEKMRAYMALLNGQGRSNDNYEQAFGRTPAQFEDILKAYYRSNRYATVTIELKDGMEDKPMHVRQLSKGEAAFHKAEAMRFFSGTGVKTAQVSAQYDIAEKLLGATPSILAARADLASWDSDYAAAQGFITRSLEKEPKSESINLIAGIIMLYKYEKNDDTGPGDIAAARKFLKRAMRANPNNVSAHYHYAKSYAVTGEAPNGQALASAETALDYYRSINFVDSNLMLASLLIKGGKDALAIPAIDKAIVWGRSSRARSSARRLRKYLN